MGKPQTPADPIAEAEAWRAKRVRVHWKPCWACTIPQAPTIAALKVRGWTSIEICDYLVEECGYSREEATRNRITHHFTDKHPERRKAS